MLKHQKIIKKGEIVGSFRRKESSSGDIDVMLCMDIKDFNDFVAYVKTKDCSYKTECEEKLEALKTASTDEKYFDAVKTQYEAIQKKLAHDKEQDLIKNKDEIITILENEIAGRYYYAYGKVKKSYQNDPEVSKAIELIKDSKQYQEILAKK